MKRVLKKPTTFYGWENCRHWGNFRHVYLRNRERDCPKTTGSALKMMFLYLFSRPKILFSAFSSRYASESWSFAFEADLFPFFETLLITVPSPLVAQWNYLVGRSIRARASVRQHLRGSFAAWPCVWYLVLLLLPCSTVGRRTIPVWCQQKFFHDEAVFSGHLLV